MDCFDAWGWQDGVMESLFGNREDDYEEDEEEH